MTDDSPVSVAKTAARGFKDVNVTFMAASIAYQAFVSLIPLLVLVVFLVSAVGDEGLASQVVTTTEGLLPESGNELLEDAIAGSVATTGASAIGLVTLLWGSLKIFRGLDTAFSEIYDSADESSFTDQLQDALVVFVAIALALVAAAAATVVFALFPDGPLVGLVNPLVLVVGLSIAFFPMYYVFPDVDLSPREVLPGVLVAAIGWAALQGLFQVYVAFASGSDSAGAIGAILLLLTWLYFGGMALLVGGVVNAAWTGHLPTADREDEAGEAADEVTEDGSTSEGPSIVDRTRIDHLERELRRRRRENALVENDLEAQRSRRYRLEDRTDRLEAENDRLEAENARLRRRLERRGGSWWARLGRTVFDRVRVLSIGTSRERRT